ncbi:MAG: serine protease [Pirellulales bacterium]
MHIRSATAKQPHPAVVRVVVPENKSQSLGSGTLIATTDTYGLVLTNWHVVRGATGPIQLTFADGSQFVATLIKTDKQWDLAALAIRKPNAEPVTIAVTAPRPGEQLTIAGYGSGRYREATGRCTQYVAPSKQHPFELLELSVEARQGDSGGPIFNKHRELTGVLLGAGGGSTVGSYCGRVELFLADVRPLLTPQSQIIASSTPSPRVGAPLVRTPPPAQPAREAVADKEWSPLAPVPPKKTTTDLPAAQPQRDVPKVAIVDESAAQPGAQSVQLYRPTIASHSPFENTTQVPKHSTTNVVRLTDVIGETPFDRIKTALAFIGALTLFIATVRIFAPES